MSVPTSPNLTSGSIEIVPLEQVVYIDWTMEEAMTFVITGGANPPDTVRYSNPLPGTATSVAGSDEQKMPAQP